MPDDNSHRDGLHAELEKYIDNLRHNSERRSYPGFDTRTANTIADELEELIDDAE